MGKKTSPRRGTIAGRKAPAHNRGREETNIRPLFKKNGHNSRKAGPNEATRERTNKKTLKPANKEGKKPSLPALYDKKNGGVLFWGLHAVREAWTNPARRCLRLWATEAGHAAIHDALENARAQGLPRPVPMVVGRDILDNLLPRASVHQGVVLEAMSLPDVTLDDFLGRDDAGESLLIVLDQVTDPHNVGAILRSTAAFGAQAVIVTERHAPAVTGVMAKTASGGAEHVPVIAVVNLARTLDALKAEGYWCIGLAEEGGASLDTMRLTGGRVALVLGAEGEGLRRLTRAHCDALARLPTTGRIGSLNVSNAAAIALYESKRQRG